MNMFSLVFKVSLGCILQPQLQLQLAVLLLAKTLNLVSSFRTSSPASRLHRLGLPPGPTDPPQSTSRQSMPKY